MWNVSMVYVVNRLYLRSCTLSDQFYCFGVGFVVQGVKWLTYNYEDYLITFYIMIILEFREGGLGREWYITVTCHPDININTAYQLFQHSD